MRKFMYTAVGAAALASASIANATVTVTSSTGLNDPNPTAAAAVVTSGPITTINFGQNAVSNPTFSGSFAFNNTLSDLYNIVISSSTPGITFSSATISGPGGVLSLLPFPDSTSLKLANASLGIGSYTFAFAGNNANVGGALTGNVTISAPVPEAATWAMMILGFGAMGIAIRRRRRPILQQLA